MENKFIEDSREMFENAKEASSKLSALNDNLKMAKGVYTEDEKREIEAVREKYKKKIAKDKDVKKILNEIENTKSVQKEFLENKEFIVGKLYISKSKGELSDEGDRLLRELTVEN